MEKKTYERPVMQVERFISNEYVAACAQYNITLTCTWPTKTVDTQNGPLTNVTYDDGVYTGADGLQHSTGWGGGCTIKITEFTANENHGGTYNNDLAMNGTSLDNYADIRTILQTKKNILVMVLLMILTVFTNMRHGHQMKELLNINTKVI